MPLPVAHHRKKSFRARMLEPKHRRSTNIIDLSGPNLEVPVRLREYPDSLWYDPLKLAPGKAENDRMLAEQAVQPSSEAMKRLVKGYSEKIRKKGKR